MCTCRCKCMCRNRFRYMSDYLRGMVIDRDNGLSMPYWGRAPSQPLFRVNCTVYVLQ